MIDLNEILIKILIRLLYQERSTIVKMCLREMQSGKQLEQTQAVHQQQEKN